MRDTTTPRPLRRLRSAVRAGTFALAAAAAAGGAGAATPTGARTVLGADSRFGYVAVFQPGTPGAAIEQWRRQVLARTHVLGCDGRPCLARSLRLSSVGAARVEALAFDLAATTPAPERVALLAAAAQSSPPARLHHDTTPRRAAGG